MTTTSAASRGIRRDAVATRSLRFVETLTADLGPRGFAVRAWDGSMLDAETGPPRFTIVLNHPGALRAMFLPPDDLSLGEAYVFGDFDVEGDLEAVFDLFDELAQHRFRPRRLPRLSRLLLMSPRAGRRPAQADAAKLSGARHSRRRDRAAIAHHYDVGNDFYALWLGKDMVYSCAYFEDPDHDLDRAQTAKLEHICRKLQLRPGERLLDVGCGWGGLAIHAAQQHGATVRGITLSEEQAAYAQRRIADLGLGDRCSVQVQDYRDVEGRFDKIVSVGMFEHVGEDNLPIYFRHAADLLEPGGLFLNHGISTAQRARRRRRRSFIGRYVFPDGELVPVSDTLVAGEEAGLEIRDVESLREHYATTLRHWVANLEAHAAEAVEAAGEVRYRVWRLYMTGCAHAFHVGRIGVYQTLFAKPDGGPSSLPPTRAGLYERPATPA